MNTKKAKKYLCIENVHAMSNGMYRVGMKAIIASSQCNEIAKSPRHMHVLLTVEEMEWLCATLGVTRAENCVNKMLNGPSWFGIWGFDYMRQAFAYYLLFMRFFAPKRVIYMPD